MTNHKTPLTWLDIIDATLCELPLEAFTEAVAQAQLLIQDVLNGHVPVEQLLNSVCSTDQNVIAEGEGQHDLSRPEERMMASMEITVTSKNGGPPIVHQKFEIDRELAQEFIDKLEAMVADLPGKHQTTKTVGQEGLTVVEIELNKPSPPPVVSPTFEELYSQRAAAGQLPSGDFGIRYCPACGERRKFSIERLAIEIALECPHCHKLVDVAGWLAENPKTERSVNDGPH
jgi:hypothetical protein